MTKFSYVLTGCANGRGVRITGRGTAGRGRLQPAFGATEPALAFDAGFAHLTGLDAIAAVTLGLVVAPDTPTFARCRADLLTEGGAEVGTIAAHVAVHRRPGAYRCEVDLVDARIAVEAGERIVTVSERELRVVPALGGVAVHSTATVETSRGHEWVVLATTFLVACEVGRADVLALPATRC